MIKNLLLKKFIPLFIYSFAYVYYMIFNWKVFVVSLNVNLGFGVVSVPPSIIFFLLGMNIYIEEMREHLRHGFHQIRTIFSEIELADIINFALTKKGTIKILSDKDFVSPKENLIYKVAIFIKERYNVKFGVKINLQKNIPIAAGLGGGSSNAASTIIALSKLWNLNLSKNEMHDIAGNFGSDINFFLEGGCALGEDRGEKITKLNSIDIDDIILVNPGFEISSEEAYKAVQLDGNESTNWKKLIDNKDINYCYNKLQEGICKKYPLIQQIINELNKNGAENAILSGSGATIIGFCPDRETARKFSKYYSDKGYWNYVTKTKRSTK